VSKQKYTIIQRNLSSISL